MKNIFLNILKKIHFRKILETFEWLKSEIHSGSELFFFNTFRKFIKNCSAKCLNYFFCEQCLLNSRTNSK